MKNIKSKLKFVGLTILGTLYFPVYATAWALHKVFRFMLAICYFLMFETRRGIDILVHLFYRYGA